MCTSKSMRKPFVKRGISEVGHLKALTAASRAFHQIIKASVLAHKQQRPVVSRIPGCRALFSFSSSYLRLSARKGELRRRPRKPSLRRRAFSDPRSPPTPHDPDSSLSKSDSSPFRGICVHVILHKVFPEERIIFRMLQCTINVLN